IGPRTEADELILAWCNQHGLLGLVPVLSNSIRPPAAIESGDHKSTRVVKKHHHRAGGIWLSQMVSPIFPPQAAEDAARRFAEEGAKPGITWFNWQSHIYEEKPLQDIELFFRPVWKDEPVNPPCPNTPLFWKSYGEPVWEFTHWCEMFTLSVDYISQWEGGKTNSENAAAVQHSHWALSGLAQSAAPTFRFNPQRNSVDEQRVSAGLLASYALMFLWDRVEGRRALRCRNCDRYFVSDVKRANYCSPRCRNTSQKRRSRARAKI
ncbi:MAG: hypothetical protein WBQ65_05580, partial [Bryobacteraceae bacterium]